MEHETKPHVESLSNPLDSSSRDFTLETINQYLEFRRKTQDLLSQYKSEVKVTLPEHGPYKIVHVGDTHLGHDHADPKALQQAVDETGSDGILITHANIIDGVSSKFIRHNTTRVGLDLDEQVKVGRAILSPLDEEGRIVPMSGNMCHEGWADKTATHDPTSNLVSIETPILITGGQVVFERNEEEVARVEGYHNSGQGNTKQSPEGAIRQRYREVPVGDPLFPDVLVSAHMHQLTAGQDVHHDPISQKDIVTSLGVVGTAKGTKDHPDRFLTAIGVPPRSQPADAGQGLVTILREDKDSHIHPYPVATYERAHVLFEAETLWENSQRTGNTKAIVEELRGVFEKPIIRLNKSQSAIRRKDSAALSEGAAPFFKTLQYHINNTNLPISIQFIGNLRVGTKSLDRKRVQEILHTMEDNPWSYFFATRRLINQGVALRPDRMSYLKNLANLLGESKSSLLGVMLTDELRSAAWSRDRTIEVVNGEDEKGEEKFKKVKVPGLSPGDWLFTESAIKDTPLMMPETVVQLKFSQTPYTLYLRDKLSHFTSLINPFHGLTRVQQVWGIKADALVGGNTEVVGWRTWMRPWGQLEVVVPGGFSEFIDKGIANRVDYPEGGQGIILFPKSKMVFSCGTADDVRDLHEALWMREGLKSRGGLDEIMKKLEKT